MVDVSRISVTSDGWSSITGDSYMSLTAHFITSNWEIRSACLKTQYHPESHTAANLAKFFTDSFHEYGLRTGNIVSITTDSAANMIAALLILPFLSTQVYLYLLIYNLLPLYKTNNEVHLQFYSLCNCYRPLHNQVFNCSIMGNNLFVSFKGSCEFLVWDI